MSHLHVSRIVNGIRKKYIDGTNFYLLNELNGTGLIVGGILTRPSSRLQDRFQSKPFGSLANPVVLTVRLAPSNTSSNCLELGFRLWRIDQINPISRARQWPLAKPTAIVCRSIDPTPETRPSPLFRALDQIGPQDVPLNVTHYLIEVCVLQQQPHPSHTTVPDVEYHPSRSISSRTRHANSLLLLARRVHIGPVPFNCLKPSARSWRDMKPTRTRPATGSFLVYGRKPGAPGKGLIQKRCQARMAPRLVKPGNAGKAGACRERATVCESSIRRSRKPN